MIIEVPAVSPSQEPLNSKHCLPAQVVLHSFWLSHIACVVKHEIAFPSMQGNLRSNPKSTKVADTRDAKARLLHL